MIIHFLDCMYTCQGTVSSYSLVLTFMNFLELSLNIRIIEALGHTKLIFGIVLNISKRTILNSFVICICLSKFPFINIVEAVWHLILYPLLLSTFNLTDPIPPPTQHI